MIGERDLARGFQSAWGEIFPLLTPACVTVFNRSHGRYLDGLGTIDREMGITSADLLHADVLAECVFEVFYDSVRQGQSCAELAQSIDTLSPPWRRAVETVSRLRVLNALPIPVPDSISHLYIQALARRYDAFKLLDICEHGLEISPELPGCGVLGVCAADISAGSTLVEIKTVDRNFSSKDIRQVLIYLALDYCSGIKRWNKAVMFNPRRAFVVSFSPAEFVSYISAGKPFGVVCREIEDFLASREFSVEHRF